MEVPDSIRTQSDLWGYLDPFTMAPPVRVGDPARDAACASDAHFLMRCLELHIHAPHRLYVMSSARIPYKMSLRTLGFVERLGAPGRSCMGCCPTRGMHRPWIRTPLLAHPFAGPRCGSRRHCIAPWHFFHNLDEDRQPLILISTVSVEVLPGATMDLPELDAFCAASSYRCPSNSRMALSAHVSADGAAMKSQATLRDALDPYFIPPPGEEAPSHEMA